MKLKNEKLVGAHVPRYISSYLSLYCRGPGLNKAALIRSILAQWVEEKGKELTTYDLIQERRKKIQLEWEAEKLKTNGNLFSKFTGFRGEWIKKLERQGVDETDIQQIIGGLSA